MSQYEYYLVSLHCLKTVCFITFQGLKFDIVTSNFEENLKKESFNSPLDYVKETAKQKVLEVTNRLYGEVINSTLEMFTSVFSSVMSSLKFIR